MPPRQQARDPRTHLGAFLGDQLRAIRVEAGYASQDDFAPVIRRDRSVIGKAETGESPSAEAVLGDWLEACGVGGRPGPALQRQRLAPLHDRADQQVTRPRAGGVPFPGAPLLLAGSP